MDNREVGGHRPLAAPQCLPRSVWNTGQTVCQMPVTRMDAGGRGASPMRVEEWFRIRRKDSRFLEHGGWGIERASFTPHQGKGGRLSARSGEVESAATSTRELEQFLLRHDAGFPPLLSTGKTGQDLQTTPFHQDWPRARRSWPILPEACGNLTACLN
jgi:hypothetical protein